SAASSPCPDFCESTIEFQCLKNLSEKTKTLPPSFPQKWESRNEKQQEFIGNDRNRTDRIPAFAGMTRF
ncbi:TPA: hypothetical protein ACJL6P_001766, partial [Neisseria meningitidis]